MLPVILSVGSFSLTSFGLFLFVSIFAGIFFTWRVGRVFDLREEKLLDLSLVTIICSLLGARIYFFLFHLNQFDSILKFLLILKYPGLSFWGGLIGGLSAFLISCRIFKLPFWVTADFAAVGLLIGLSVGDLGCLLSSCGSGINSSLFLAVHQIGLIGKRFPIQALESIAFLVSFLNIFPQALKFHFSGKIASTCLIIIGLIKFLSEFLIGDPQKFLPYLSLGHFFSLLLIILGIRVYYAESKRKLLIDLIAWGHFFSDSKFRNRVVQNLSRRWYNLTIAWKLTLSKKSQRLLKKINVKPTPPKF